MVRCAPATRAAGIDPVGSAGHHPGFLLVTWPLPWPRAAEDVPALAPVVTQAAAAGLRIQLVPPSGGPGATSYRRRPDPDGWFTGYERRRSGTEDDPVGAALALLAGAADEPVPGGDVLVCSHGKRDACCGSAGTVVARDLQAAPPRTAEVHRTSHLGGHRFAPTALVLPQGTVWSGLEADALRAVADRQGPLADLLPHYRGSTGIGGPPAQALERVAFSDLGWGWLDHRRRSTEPADGRVRVEAVAPDGTKRIWEATAGRRQYLVPTCGSDDETGVDAYTEVVLDDVARVA